METYESGPYLKIVFKYLYCYAIDPQAPEQKF